MIQRLFGTRICNARSTYRESWCFQLRDCSSGACKWSWQLRHSLASRDGVPSWLGIMLPLNSETVFMAQSKATYELVVDFFLNLFMAWILLCSHFLLIIWFRISFSNCTGRADLAPAWEQEAEGHCGSNVIGRWIFRGGSDESGRCSFTLHTISGYDASNYDPCSWIADSWCRCRDSWGHWKLKTTLVYSEQSCTWRHYARME